MIDVSEGKKVQPGRIAVTAQVAEYKNSFMKCLWSAIGIGAMGTRNCLQTRDHLYELAGDHFVIRTPAPDQLTEQLCSKIISSEGCGRF